MKKYLIFTDIDGTIYSHKMKSISDSTKETLKLLKSNGHKVFLCTGRCYQQLYDYLLELPIDGLILGCGTHIIHDMKDVFLKVIPKDDLKRLIDYMIQNNIGFILEGHHHTFMYGAAIDLFREVERQNLGNVSNEKADKSLSCHRMYPFNQIKEEDYEQILKFSFFTLDEVSAQYMIDHLPSSVKGYVVDDPWSCYKHGEITPVDISKATGIDKVVELLNHDPNNVIGIGDGFNDIEMIKHVPIGIAMGNACDELKEIADYITKDIHEDGFEYTFKYFKLI